jgi:hypothetical protein
MVKRRADCVEAVDSSVECKDESLPNKKVMTLNGAELDEWTDVEKGLVTIIRLLFQEENFVDVCRVIFEGKFMGERCVKVCQDIKFKSTAQLHKWRIIQSLLMVKEPDMYLERGIMYLANLMQNKDMIRVFPCASDLDLRVGARISRRRGVIEKIGHHFRLFFSVCHHRYISHGYQYRWLEEVCDSYDCTAGFMTNPELRNMNKSSIIYEIIAKYTAFDQNQTKVISRLLDFCFPYQGINIGYITLVYRSEPLFNSICLPIRLPIHAKTHSIYNRPETIYDAIVSRYNFTKTLSSHVSNTTQLPKVLVPMILKFIVLPPEDMFVFTHCKNQTDILAHAMHQFVSNIISKLSNSEHSPLPPLPASNKFFLENKRHKK